MSYTVSLRVEKNIRYAITDFRDFVSVTCEIMEKEISFCQNTQAPIREANYTETVPQAILVLWFPFFGLTKDFNRNQLDAALANAKRHKCHTRLITSKNPLEIMQFFDEYYIESSKKYSQEDFKNLMEKFRNCNISAIDLNGVSYGDVLNESIEDLKNLHSPRDFWCVEEIDNEKLMRGLLQIVWTSKKAAIVFMPPNMKQKTNIPKDKVFRCSGFATEDPFMLSMIKDLIELHFEPEGNLY